MNMLELSPFSRNTSSITKDEFCILTFLEKNKEQKTSEDFVVALGLDSATAEMTLSDLMEKGWVDADGLTTTGLDVLEPYKVQRAVFLAAGFGSRLVPITFNTPKPLVRVHGVRMIDTLLDAVVAAEIPEIVIVRGYLGEQFDQLLYKYPKIRFVENPIYNEANNISSAMCVRYLLRNAYVLEADLVLKNPSLIRKYEYQSNFLGIPVKVTDDWCIHSDEEGFIAEECVGGRNCHQMVGISYWNDVDGARLANDIEKVYKSPGGKERYWEQVALVYNKDDYRVAIRECSFSDVTEIDTFGELKQIDSLYAK